MPYIDLRVLQLSYFRWGEAMKTTRISSKGQVVLPKSLRESKKWQSGTELAVEAVDGGVFLRTLQPFPGNNDRARVRVPEIQGKAQECSGDGQGDYKGNEETPWSRQILTSLCVS